MPEFTLAAHCQAIIDAGRDPLLVIDAEMRCLHMNLVARKTLEIADQDYRHRPLDELVPDYAGGFPADGEGCPLQAAFRHGAFGRTIRALRLHPSLPRTYEISTEPLGDETGKLTAVVAVFRDITASLDHMNLTEMSAQIERAKKEWESTMDCVQDFVLLLDDHGCIKRLNRALTVFSGHSFATILGRDFKAFLAAHHLTKEPTDADTTGVEYLHHPSGRSFTMRTYPLTTHQGKMKVVTMHDITQRKFATRQLAEKNREIEQAFTELQAAQAHLLQQEKMASVGQLAAGVAHEINNPVGFVTSNITTLGKYLAKVNEFVALQNKFVTKYCPDKDKVRTLKEYGRKMKIDIILADTKDLIDESLDGVERVKKIVMGLKNFSRVDQADRGTVNINDCLDDTIMIAWNELKYTCTLHKEYGDLPLLTCYPQQLNQVFLNMLINGAQAMDEPGSITIKTWHDHRAIFISFTDTGCGIAADKLPHIFEPFYTSKEVGKGTGLGLSIAYDIIYKQHSGTITVSSEEGKGSTFTIRLPLPAAEDTP